MNHVINDVDASKPLSRVEVLMHEILAKIDEGGGGGSDPANTASEEDIQGIEDSIWNN